MRGAMVAIAGLAAAAFLTVTALAQSRGMGRMNGIVADEAGQPIEGVTIKAQLGDGDSIDAVSDDKGNWVIGGIARGEWTVLFTKSGYVTIRAKVLLEKELARTQPVKITMRKAP